MPSKKTETKKKATKKKTISKKVSQPKKRKCGKCKKRKKSKTDPCKCGRNTKNTEAVRTKLVSYIKLGAHPDLACERAGISRKSYDRRMKSSKEFCLEIKAAESFANFLARDTRLRAVKKGDRRAAESRLKRTDPEFRDKQEISGQGGGPVEITIETTTDKDVTSKE